MLLTVDMPATYSVTKAWLRAPSRNWMFRRLRNTGVAARLRSEISSSPTSATMVSCQLYQNITARKMTRNGRSRIRDTAAPDRKSRIVSTPCRRETTTPVGRCSK